MLTRAQKEEQVKAGIQALKENESLILADFSGVPISDIQKLRQALRNSGAKFQVFKKRLLKIALKESGIGFDPMSFPAQTGAILTPDVLAVAGPIAKFSKDLEKQNRKFIVLGGYNMKEGKEITLSEFNVLATLPSRETLLAKLAIVFSMPIRQFAFALNARKEQLESTKN